MRRNLRVFFGVAFWIPFSWFVWSFFKGYAHTKFAERVELCWQSGVDIPSANNATQPNIANFVGCLKQKTNPILWWYLEPERLFQIAQPHTPCQWVGRWQVKRDSMAFGIELKADGRYVIDVRNFEQVRPVAQNEASFEGVWSSPELNRILWFNEARFWPIEDNRVEWLNQDQLVIHETNNTKTYYQRVSSRVPNCPSYP
jgi:hypothetical protein